MKGRRSLHVFWLPSWLYLCEYIAQRQQMNTVCKILWIRGSPHNESRRSGSNGKCLCHRADYSADPA
jgi:hypothetical protein